jgi:type IV pilus assembly protein PilX
MRRIAFRRHECGSVLVVAVLMILVLTILGMAATTNSRIERLIAGNDKVHKEVFSSTEHALVLAEATLEQLLRRAELDEDTTAGHWGPDQQPPWGQLQWDD